MFSPPRHQGHQAHPPILSNAKTQRRKDAKATQPPIWPTDHTDRHRWVHTGLLCVARFWPPNGGQVLPGRSTAPNASLRPGFPARQPALSERRPRLFFPLFVGWEEPVLLSYRKKERQNHLSSSATISLRLCAFAPLRYWVGGWIWVYLCDLWANLGEWAALHLCGSAPLRFFWCLDGSKTVQNS